MYWFIGIMIFLAIVVIIAPGGDGPNDYDMDVGA